MVDAEASGDDGTSAKEGASQPAGDGSSSKAASVPKPYHLMTPEERRASWAAVREANRKDARRSTRTPWIFLALFVLSIVFGLWSLRHEQRIVGVTLLYASVAFAGFGVIALAKNLVHGLPDTGELPPPPGM